MEPIHLQGKSLFDKQRLYFNGSHCVYCGKPTDLVDSIKVYQQSWGLIFLCVPCMAWVNTHHRTSDHAFGFVAQEGLRKLRHIAHQKFDPLCEKKVAQGMSRKQAQAAGRKWMATLLNIPVEIAHIGMLYDDQCKILIAECEKHYLTPENIENKKLALKRDIETIHFLAGEFDFTASEIELMGKHSFTLSKEGRTKMFLKLPENIYAFDGKRGIKYKPIKDLEKVITDHFK